jgi:hypothetical protein
MALDDGSDAHVGSVPENVVLPCTAFEVEGQFVDVALAPVDNVVKVMVGTMSAVALSASLILLLLTL